MSRGNLNHSQLSVTDHKRVQNHFQGGNGSGQSLIYRVDESEAVKVDSACAIRAVFGPNIFPATDILGIL